VTALDVDDAPLASVTFARTVKVPAAVNFLVDTKLPGAMSVPDV